MKCQILFPGKNIKNTSECLKILPRELSINNVWESAQFLKLYILLMNLHSGNCNYCVISNK